jgi:hypothetical protein
LSFHLDMKRKGTIVTVARINITTRTLMNSGERGGVSSVAKGPVHNNAALDTNRPAEQDTSLIRSWQPVNNTAKDTEVLPSSSDATSVDSITIATNNSAPILSTSTTSATHAMSFTRDENSEINQRVHKAVQVEHVTTPRPQITYVRNILPPRAPKKLGMAIRHKMDF